MATTSAYARLNARVMPLDRGELYEDPLGDALEESGLGAVSGGGTMQRETGEISYCGIDLDLDTDRLDQAVAFVCRVLEENGAPKGSAVEYERDGQKVEVPFGVTEGLAVYLNGTELPAEVYENSDINVVYEDINRLLDDRGGIQGHWQGPTETALYLYGYSAGEMRGLIADYMASCPLCQRARVVQIA